MIKMKVYESWREYYSDPDAERMLWRYSEKCRHMDGKPPFRDPESYPLFGEKIELYVQKKEIDEEDPFYRKLYDEHVFDRSYRLFIGKDRQYYTDAHADLRYHWREDIDGILRYIDKLEP